MSTSFVIRPGDTDFDTEKRIQGTLNLPLNRLGEAQVEEIVESVHTSGLDVIYSSPNEPALSTAKRIAESLGKPLKVLEDLTNVNLGLWQGLSLSEIRLKQPRVYKQWAEQSGTCPPHGETCEEARERVTRVLKKPMKRSKTFAVVVSEPLATVVMGVLSGNNDSLPGPLCGCINSSRVEKVQRIDKDAIAADK